MCVSVCVRKNDDDATVTVASQLIFSHMKCPAIGQKSMCVIWGNGLTVFNPADFRSGTPIHLTLQ